MQLNDGLEKLGEREVICGKELEGGAFMGSAIESVKLPSTLKRIEAETFTDCYNLKNIEISNGVEYLGKECFASSGIEEITLPSTVREVGEHGFGDCERLRVVQAEDSLAAVIRNNVDDSVVVIPTS